MPSDGCVCPRQRLTLGEQQAIVTFGRKSVVKLVRRCSVLRFGWNPRVARKSM